MLIQRGDRDKLLELWEQVRRFVLKQANRWAVYQNGGMELEDYMQTGFLALLVAYTDYDPSSGCFLTWYGMCLKSAFTEAAGRRTQRDRKDPIQGALSLDAPLTEGEGDPLTLADILPDPEAEMQMETVEERDRLARLHEALEEALAELPADQSEAIRAEYYRGQRVASKARNAALRAIRHPRISRALRAYL